MIGRLLVVSGLVAALITGCGSAVRPDCQIVMWDVGQSPPEEGAPMPAEVEPLIMPADVDWGSSQFGRGAIGQPTVTLALGPDGATRMAEFTRSNIGSYVAIALNGRVVTVPLVTGAIEGGAVQIEASSRGEPLFAPFSSCVGG